MRNVKNRDGSLMASIDTDSMPDGAIYTPCGNRRASVCPSCAAQNPERARFCLECGTALESLILQYSQDLGLSERSHIANLIEEKRAAVGFFEQAFFVSNGSGKRTFDVSKKLGF